MPPKTRTSGRLPEVRTTPSVDVALIVLAAKYPEQPMSEIIRQAIIDYAKKAKR